MLTLGPNDEQFGRERNVCPQSGQLMLFPSWLSHSVVTLEAELKVKTSSKLDRIAVAFNVHGAEL